jgi:hypothetical protein
MMTARPIAMPAIMRSLSLEVSMPGWNIRQIRFLDLDLNHSVFRAANVGRQLGGCESLILSQLR